MYIVPACILNLSLFFIVPCFIVLDENAHPHPASQEPPAPKEMGLVCQNKAALAGRLIGMQHIWVT